MKLAAMMVVGLGVFAAHSASAKPACSSPDPVVLNGSDELGFYKVQVTPLGRSDGKSLRWATLSKSSQLLGSASVIDCRGAVKAHIGLGAVEVQKPGPSIAGHPSLIVVYHPMSGTNVDIRNVALLQYRKGKIMELWDHRALEGQYPPKGIGDQEETIYSWRFSLDSLRLYVTGRDVVYRYLETNRPFRKSDIRRIHLLRPERFCLNRSSNRYVRCK
jgi:hypothetical protein